MYDFMRDAYLAGGEWVSSTAIAAAGGPRNTQWWAERNANIARQSPSASEAQGTEQHWSSRPCLTCAAFHHCDPEDIDGHDGYCCNAEAPTSSREYGGHWANSKDTCSSWEAREKVDAVARCLPNQAEPTTRESKPSTPHLPRVQSMRLGLWSQLKRWYHYPASRPWWTR